MTPPKWCPATDRSPTRRGLSEYHALLVTTRDRMAKLIAEGKSLDDVYAAKPFADLDSKVGGAEGPAKNYIRAVYMSLKG